MKNSLIFTVMLMLGATLSAQTSNAWIQEGASWHHKFQLFEQGYYHFYLHENIEIDGLDFQHVKLESQTAYHQGGGVYTIGPVTSSDFEYLFHTSNDSVYIRKPDGDLQFVWHNNPQIGDVWDFGAQTEFSSSGADEANAYAIVQDIQTVYINGVETKEIFAVPCIDAIGTLFDSETLDDEHPVAMYVSQINTLLGPIKDFSKIGFYYSPAMIAATSFPFVEILCYESDEFALYQFPESVDCYAGIHSLSIDDLDQQRFVVYPSPAKEQIHFSGLASNQNVVVYSNLGQVLFTIQGTQTQTADVSHLAEGLYFYRIVDEANSEVFAGKFVKE